MSPTYIAHRINTQTQLADVPTSYGVELDLRDRCERLILQHDPFQDGEDFCDYLEHYNHNTMILNIKSERIEHRVLDELAAAATVRDYFFLDCSYPMIRTLVSAGEHRIAIRFSEFEPIENAMRLAGQVDWVWVDCFTRMPLDDRSYGQLAEAFKICIVSPELQGHSLERIAEFSNLLRDYPVDAICTKRPDLWQSARDEKESQKGIQ